MSGGGLGTRPTRTYTVGYIHKLVIEMGTGWIVHRLNVI